MSTALEIIERLTAVQPDVVRLARVASLAAKIEPTLLRRLRLALLPASDAGLEADLRFSPLTRSHNASSIVLHAEVVDLLRQQLAEPANRKLLDQAWPIIKAVHHAAPSIIQLEENVTRLALDGETSAAALEAELQRAVRAMAHENRPGIAQWAARALPRLPMRARRSEAAWLLAVGAAARLGGREIFSEDTGADVSPELLRAVLPHDAGRAQIGARLLVDGIEFGDLRLPGAKLLDVPNASPVILHLEWDLDGTAANEAPRQTRAVFSLGSRKTFAPPAAGPAQVSDGFIYICCAAEDEEAIVQLSAELERLELPWKRSLAHIERNTSWLASVERHVATAQLIVVAMSRASIAGRNWLDREWDFITRRMRGNDDGGVIILSVDGVTPEEASSTRAFDRLPWLPAPRGRLDSRTLADIAERYRSRQPPAPRTAVSLREIHITTALGDRHSLRPVKISAVHSATADKLLRRLTRPGPKRILALDSGGMRCTIGLQFLARLEALLRERFDDDDLRLADYFDLIGGTSTAALFASALAMGASVAELAAQWERLSPSIFTTANFLQRWQHKFDDSGLNRGLAEILGNQTMMSASMRTGLCLLAKRADTGAVYSLLNHPESAGFPYRSNVLLRDAVRASMAAPTYFAPVPLELGPAESGVFMDAGASMMADPALHLFFVVRARGQPFHWKAGADQLLLVSVGSGAVHQPPGVEQAQRFNLLDWASQVPSILLQSGRTQAQRLLRQLAHTLHMATPGQPPPLPDEVLGGQAQLTYLRCDVALDAARLAQLGLPELARRPDSLHAFDDPERLADFIAVGRAAAGEINASHLPPQFDPEFEEVNPPTSAPRKRK